MRRIILFLFIFLALSLFCKSQIHHLTQAKNEFYNTDNWLKELHSYDTTTKSGYMIRYKIIDSDYFQIKWGTKNNLHTYKDSFENDIADADIPHLNYETKNFLILRYGCGNPCWKCVALSKNPLLKSQDIMFPEDYDYEKDLLAYWNYEKKGLTISVRNLRTNKEKSYCLCDTCFSSVPE